MQSVIQDAVRILASHLIDFNVSSKTHYYQIRAAFAKEYSLNEFKDNRDLVRPILINYDNHKSLSN